MKPMESVPCLSTSRTSSSGPSFSESSQTPCPIRKGKLRTLLAALDLEPLQQLADDKVEHLVKAAEKGLDVAAAPEWQAAAD